MIRHLKTARSAEKRSSNDLKLRQTVETIFAEIEPHGDAAVREFAQTFDHYSALPFRLSASEIEILMGRVDAREMETIRFARDQVSGFAEVQRTSMRDVEMETLPSVILGYRNTPVAFIQH